MNWMLVVIVASAPVQTNLVFPTLMACYAAETQMRKQYTDVFNEAVKGQNISEESKRFMMSQMHSGTCIPTRGTASPAAQHPNNRRREGGGGVGVVVVPVRAAALGEVDQPREHGERGKHAVVVLVEDMLNFLRVHRRQKLAKQEHGVRFADLSGQAAIRAGLAFDLGIDVVWGNRHPSSPDLARRHAADHVRLCLAPLVQAGDVDQFVNRPCLVVNHPVWRFVLNSLFVPRVQAALAQV